MLTTALVLAGCGSAFAPVDPPDGGAPPVDDAGIVFVDAPTPADAFVSTAEAGPSEAGVDADAAGACVAPKKLEGEACTTSSDCCSNACASNSKCVASCKTSGGCTPGNADCCVGHFCSYDTGVNCQPCRAAGQPADRFPITGALVPSSCCSGNADAGTGKCTP